ncbi:MAG: segregation/condensation protein A [Lachnospiraceae bacterium]|nr:segregation/condensation protein A [Lachnospiraceae bacterium]MDE6698701.1 segregation/condensation protein A [Lachnospiraceae bacterium]
MGISVKLKVFEGPLDLLLHLIDKNKVNIYDIPIVDITDQYLEYVNAMDRQDLNVISEFLVMAATLIDIKSRMLLPKEVNEEGEEEDPRDELVQKLLEYKMYKYMSLELRDREIDAEKAMFKKPTIPEEVSKYDPPIDLDKLLDDVTLKKLNDIFNMVMKKQEDKVDPIRSKFGRIEKEEVSLPDKMEFIKDYAHTYKSFSFKTLLESQRTKMHIIVSFLAILELMKIGEITISQDGTFEDIIVTSTKVSTISTGASD